MTTLLGDAPIYPPPASTSRRPCGGCSCGRGLVSNEEVLEEVKAVRRELEAKRGR